ncbi:uncharacterized protein J4E87_006969 [Alternaria ethzedia]|uniref:uncharacterized protein n=1 Tax=Alternaria ethzedia TaxID=181014 RepID=UPI0020C2F122|nr:uncharacterized protein J4E87_006969 [Alternaria ethzedia]KAI4620644.1 hypothetical protein J4E87_006969 [Alternaria ethzedia]
MSVIGEAAAIIGITDVAVKSIKGLYEFLRAIKDAPRDIVLIRVDVQGLQAKLSDLEFLSKADARTVDEVKETGIAKVINDCGTQCDEFEKLVGKWIKHDDKSWRDKLRVALNQSRIQKYKAVLWSAARELDSAVGILTLINVSNRSPEQQAASMNQLGEELALLAVEADARRNDVPPRLVAIAESDEDEAEYVQQELKAGDTALEEFIQRCKATTAHLQAVKLDQQIGNIQTGEEGYAQVGMPLEAVEKVSRHHVGNVTTGKKGTSQIGIYPASNKAGSTGEPGQALLGDFRVHPIESEDITAIRKPLISLLHLEMLNVPSLYRKQPSQPPIPSPTTPTPDPNLGLTHKTHTLPSGTTFHIWTPTSTPIATIILQHGYAEYSLRYLTSHSSLITHLLAANYAIYALDLHGHGTSPGHTRAVVHPTISHSGVMLLNKEGEDQLYCLDTPSVV